MKTTLIVITAITFILFIALVTCMIKHSRLSLEMAIVSDHVDIICASENTAMNSVPKETIEHLKYIATYYPAGSRLEPGGRAEKIVETVRKMAVGNIITHLKQTTGKDFGSDTHAWIEYFKSSK